MAGNGERHHRSLLRSSIRLAASYTYFSLNSAWGDQPIDFFLHEFLKMGEISNGVSFEFVGMVTGPLIAVWLVALGVLSLGIQKEFLNLQIS